MVAARRAIGSRGLASTLIRARGKGNATRRCQRSVRAYRWPERHSVRRSLARGWHVADISL